ncbi:MAG: sensor histidine kinase [Lachnospiraceae bacterium]|nr:sensor histidine kinase [Lachnospiraceae bacterium]
MNKLEIFEDLYYSYLSKKKDICNLILDNDNKISEIDEFLSKVDATDEDLKFFSPFTASSVYEGKIESEKKLRSELLSLNEDYLNQVKDLDKRILQFKELIDDENESINDTNNLSVEKSSINDDITEFDAGRHIMDIQEKERSRIAAELHDSTVQNLVHIVHSLELSSMFINQDPVRAKLELETCSKNIKNVIDGIRETIFNLRPMSFNDLGFVNSINDFINNLKVHYSSVNFISEIDDVGDCQELNLNIFRIIQECLINSMKHSNATEVMLHVKHNDDTIEIIVSDNGIGFDYNEKKKNHFGLSIMEERINLLKGDFSIISNSTNGTRIQVIIPLVS